MCGIAGVLRRAGSVRREDLLDMGGELLHRGPDGSGLYRDAELGMVNTRLSIVDLTGGDQPIGNEDGRFWVMQNGEIFNHVELRDELERLGHRFSTTCDTEVLVHAFEEWGPACLDRLNGEFAFAVWDRRDRELFLARDRFGIRPLFLTESSAGVVFGSEIKALLRYPGVEREFDPTALVDVFTCWAPSPDRSVFKGVRELAAGHYAHVTRAGIREERCWWVPPLLRPQPPEPAREDQLVEELRALLLDAVKLRLRADVPVGVYLSGGLDSSAVASCVRRVSDCALRSFAVRFDDPLFDEGRYQERMAAVLATELSSVRVGGREIAERFPDVIWLAETPMVRTAPAPLLALSGHVRECGFKVVLTGEGADELFAGYDLFREDKLRRFWARQPASRLRPLLFRRIYPFLARETGRTSAMWSAFFGKDLTRTDDPLYSHRIRFANTSRILRLANPELVANGTDVGTPEERLIGRLPAEFAAASPLKRAQYLETITFMEGYLLHAQGDRMLMGNAVEGRFPYLDYRLAELAARAPDRSLLRVLREKHLLREAMSPLVPKDIVTRQKHPYRAPILRAFVGPDAPAYVKDLLDPAHVAKTRIFQSDLVERLLAKCSANYERGVSETDEMALVGVLSTLLLHQQLIERPRVSSPAVPSREVVGADTVVSERRPPHAARLVP